MKSPITAALLFVMLVTNCQQISQQQHNRPVVLKIVGGPKEDRSIIKLRELEYASLSFSQKQQIIRALVNAFDWGNIKKESIFYSDLWYTTLYPALLKKCPWIRTYMEETFSSHLEEMLITEYLPIHLNDKKAWDCLFRITYTHYGDKGWRPTSAKVNKLLDEQAKKTPNLKTIYAKEMQKRYEFR